MEDIVNTDAAIWHFASGIFKDLRPVGMQNRKAILEKKTELEKRTYSKEKIDEYLKTIYFFTDKTVLTYDQVETLRKNEFKVWQNKDSLYSYKLSLLENKNFIDKIQFFSTEQENNYNDKNWDKAFATVKSINEFNIAKREYERNKWDFLLKEYGIKEYYTVDEYINDVDKIITQNSDYYLRLNIKKGSRSQYASYIPHIGVTVNKPLEASLITKMSFK